MSLLLLTLSLGWLIISTALPTKQCQTAVTLPEVIYGQEQAHFV